MIHPFCVRERKRKKERTDSVSLSKMLAAAMEILAGGSSGINWPFGPKTMSVYSMLDKGLNFLDGKLPKIIFPTSPLDSFDAIEKIGKQKSSVFTLCGKVGW